VLLYAAIGSQSKLSADALSSAANTAFSLSKNIKVASAVAVTTAPSNVTALTGSGQFVCSTPVGTITLDMKNADSNSNNSIQVNTSVSSSATNVVAMARAGNVGSRARVFALPYNPLLQNNNATITPALNPPGGPALK